MGALNEEYPNLGWNGNGKSTHSGFIDIGISLGIPGLILIISAIVYLIISGGIGFLNSSSNKFKITSFLLGITILFTYTLGELGNSHSIEILIYIIGLCTALNFSEVKNKITIKNE